MTNKKILKIISAIWTIFGFIIFLKGYCMEGLLAMILGELIDIPKK